MRRVFLTNITGNEKLAKPVYDKEGRILLTEGTPVRPNYINRLLELGIEAIYVEDNISEGIEIEDVLLDETRTKSRLEVKKLFERFSRQGDIQVDGIMEAANKIIDEILQQKEIIINIHDIRSQDEYTYAHCVNVCALSVMLGIKMGYNMIRLKEIAVGALLHDLGKILVPNDILNKPGKLTNNEYEVIKSHARDGYEAIKGERYISAISKVIILNHHERWDGLGYPMSLKGEEIHEAVRLVSICDVFDAMTSERVYRKGMKVYEVVEYLMAMSDKQFDSRMVEKFLQYVAVYPSGTGVVLNTGAKGIVMRQNRKLPTRPVIRLLFNSSGTPLQDHKETDLSKEMTIFIIDTYEI